MTPNLFQKVLFRTTSTYTKKYELDESFVTIKINYITANVLREIIKQVKSDTGLSPQIYTLVNDRNLDNYKAALGARKYVTLF